MRTSRAASVHPTFAVASARGGAGAPVRRCARPDCSGIGAVTLVCDYAARTVVMVAAADAPEVDDPARYDLCARHADRFRPPHGWELTVDVREPAPAATLVSEPAATPAPAERAANAFAQLAMLDVDPRELAAALG